MNEPVEQSTHIEMEVRIEPDADGHTGRECPTCKKYFKVKGGTGLPGSPPCHCPYCNYVGPQTEFFTEDQVEYARSVALHGFSGALLASLKTLEMKPDPRALISIGISVQGSPTPIIHYSEKELEERVTCSACTLQYSIYGVFAYCPDCGIHNSLQILNASFDVIVKTLDLAKAAPADIGIKLVENALEDAVSAFDGFGREHCSGLAFKVSFQSIEGARDKLLKETGIDISAPLDPSRWEFVCGQFPKRHLLAHKMGVVDAEFIARTNARQSLLGRKVSISEQDVRGLIDELRRIADTLYQGIAKP